MRALFVTLDRSQGGLGIGLTLVRALVELHGGAVQGRSKGAGQGSEFVVTLPALVLDASSLATPAVHEQLPTADHRCVLLVEDNPDGLEAVAILLRSMGHEVRTARDGPAALKDAAVHPPEVVLLDIGLPGMDGYEVARRLRQEQAKGRRMTVVALTGYGLEDDRRRSREAGFDHHLVKPVGVEDLRRVIDGQIPAGPQSERSESGSTSPG